MSYNLKDLYSPAFYHDLSTILNKVLSDFDQDQFIQAIFDEQWEQRELKDRIKHTALVLHQFMPEAYPQAAKKLVSIVKELQANQIRESSIEYMFLPAYIENFGLHHFSASVQVMEKITPFTSCEFAVRPFYLEHQEKMLAKTVQWSRHKNLHVRRLASEGCRPRLPWAMALPFLKKDPAPILPVLEQLKNDESEYVRRSVANNLNDICKDNPDVALQLASSWKGQSKEVDWVVKHGIRTLLKQGNAAALGLFGFAAPKNIEVDNFNIKTPSVKMGQDLVFAFELHNRAAKKAKVRLEYGMYYMKKNGSVTRKVFQISEKEYPANSVTTIEKRQSFKPITTRVYYPGTHEVSIIVNGVEKGKMAFELN
jgi:3-methyladenine DNA glycosylase AlkC/uncharacterized protein YjeT (DUF2065 family)